MEDKFVFQGHTVKPVEMSFGSLSEALNQPKLLKASKMSYFTCILCFCSLPGGPTA